VSRARFPSQLASTLVTATPVPSISASFVHASAGSTISVHLIILYNRKRGGRGGAVTVSSRLQNMLGPTHIGEVARGAGTPRSGGAAERRLYGLA
jgi:hypothetical protein